MRRRRTRVLGIAMAVLVGTTGCSALATAQIPEVQPIPEVHLVQVSRQPVGSPAAVRVAHVGHVSRSSTEWTVDAVDPTSSTVTMRWTDGFSPKCGEVNRVEVAERTDSVTVGLSDTADDPSLTCAAAGVLHRFDLHLSHPLAGRALLEPVTGINDGLPHFRSGTPPLPACSTNATPSDVPVGMPDAGARLAPRSAVRAAVCRTTWPHGSARTGEAQLSDADAVQQLVRLLNRAPRTRTTGTTPPPCGTRSPGSWYAVYLTGPHTQVEVFVDEIDCATMTNGALRAAATPAIERRLRSYFPS